MGSRVDRLAAALAVHPSVAGHARVGARSGDRRDDGRSAFLRSGGRGDDGRVGDRRGRHDDSGLRGVDDWGRGRSGRAGCRGRSVGAGGCEVSGATSAHDGPAAGDASADADDASDLLPFLAAAGLTEAASAVDGPQTSHEPDFVYDDHPYEELV